jgi:hypothetical protein
MILSFQNFRVMSEDVSSYGLCWSDEHSNHFFCTIRNSDCILIDTDTREHTFNMFESFFQPIKGD